MLPNATLLLRRKLRLKKFTGSPECQQATTAGTCTAVELELAASGCNMPASRALPGGARALAKLARAGPCPTVTVTSSGMVNGMAAPPLVSAEWRKSRSRIVR
eukprot:scaffold33472_cov101-Isochrysis_galbana.AAC.2